MMISPGTPRNQSSSGTINASFPVAQVAPGSITGTAVVRAGSCIPDRGCIPVHVAVPLCPIQPRVSVYLSATRARLEP
jgi:hypothetical protein